MRPRYITATSCARYSTIEMLWVMKQVGDAQARLQRLSRVEDLRCTDTSSLWWASSQTISFARPASHARDRDALALAAGKIHAGSAPAPRSQPYLLEQLGDAVHAVLVVRPMPRLSLPSARSRHRHMRGFSDA